MLELRTHDVTSRLGGLPSLRLHVPGQRAVTALPDEFRVLLRDWSRVSGHLFKPSGKWGYVAELDYGPDVPRLLSGPERSEWEAEHGPAEYLNPSDAAERALERATSNGTSGVGINAVGDYWTLVVTDPPNGWPVMVRPKPPAHRGL